MKQSTQLFHVIGTQAPTGTFLFDSKEFVHAQMTLKLPLLVPCHKGSMVITDRAALCSAHYEQILFIENLPVTIVENWL